MNSKELLLPSRAHCQRLDAPEVGPYLSTIGLRRRKCCFGGAAVADRAARGGGDLKCGRTAADALLQHAGFPFSKQRGQQSEIDIDAGQVISTDPPGSATVTMFPERRDLIEEESAMASFESREKVWTPPISQRE